MAAILTIFKYQTQLQSYLRYDKIVPKYANKKVFYGDDVIDDVTGWPQIFSIFMFKTGWLREQIARAIFRQ